MNIRHLTTATAAGIALCSLAATAAAEVVSLPCTADTSICCHPSEVTHNMGACPRIKIKGIENVLLLDFDTSAIRGRAVASATLYLTSAIPNPMLRKLGVSTVACPWVEGARTQQEPAQDGESTFLSPEQGRRDWAGAGTDFTYASFGSGGTTWHRVYLEPPADGVFAVPIEARLLEALAQGRSYGLAIADDNGEVMNIPKEVRPDTCFDNNYVYSRESGDRGPRLQATLRPAAETPAPAAPTATATAGPGGQPPPPITPPHDLLVLPAAKEVAGLEPSVRNAAMRVWALPDLLKVNPVTGNLLEEPGVSYAGPAAGTYRRANPAWDGTAGRITAGGAAGEWVAFQIVIEAVAATLAEVRVTLDPALRQEGADSAALRLEHSTVSRAWYLPVEGAWYADPLVPIRDAFDIPWAENGVPGQRNQTLYVEFFIPRQAPPGRYDGTVTIAARGVPEFRLPLSLEVYPFLIPDDLHFVWSMNAYSSPGRTWGEPSEPKFLAAERDFYVQSQQHRTCLAVLHYSQRGIIGDDAAPPLTGQGAALRVADWSAFDARFGPLFDGTAFAGTPRAGLPLDHFYLPLHENWPVTMAAGYAWNAVPFEDHWRVCGPVEQGFNADYQAAWKAILADFAAHARDQGWTQTRFQVYLNNKFYYKQFDVKTGKPGRGSSFWLLDEPAYADDFLALAFFGRLARQALGEARLPVVFRADISRPQYQRDSLDGLIDVNVCGNYAGYRQGVDHRRERFGETLWTYGGLPKVNATALELAARAVWLYGQTVDGFVPWLTLGGPEAWKEASETIAFYPGTPVGSDGCVPSLRLKACRRGQQDVEYLWLLAQRRGLDRRQIGALTRDSLALACETKALDNQGARFEVPTGLTPDRLDRFRTAVATALTQRP
jgi:hypothetical protein